MQSSNAKSLRVHQTNCLRDISFYCSQQSEQTRSVFFSPRHCLKACVNNWPASSVYPGGPKFTWERYLFLRACTPQVQSHSHAIIQAVHSSRGHRRRWDVRVQGGSVNSKAHVQKQTCLLQTRGEKNVLGISRQCKQMHMGRNIHTHKSARTVYVWTCWFTASGDRF